MIPQGRASQKGAVNRAKILEAIQAFGPIGTPELYELFSVWSKSTVSIAIKALHDAKQIHIDSWTRQIDGYSGPFGRIWKAGPGKDAPKPKPKSRKEVYLDYYHRNSARISVTRSGSRSRLNASENPFAALLR